MIVAVRSANIFGTRSYNPFTAANLLALGGVMKVVCFGSTSASTVLTVLSLCRPNGELVEDSTSSSFSCSTRPICTPCGGLVRQGGDGPRRGPPQRDPEATSADSVFPLIPASESVCSAVPGALRINRFHLPPREVPHRQPSRRRRRVRACCRT